MAITSSTNRSTLSRVLLPGLLAGLCVNAIDIPNSAALVSPSWTRFLTDHGITLDVPVVSAFYTTFHFLYGVGLVFAYAIFRDRYGAGTRTALYSTLFVLAIHRGFGFGNVVMGTMPLGIYLAFSASMTLGSLLGGVLGARLYERSHRS
jgi:hypothetical protein